MFLSLTVLFYEVEIVRIPIIWSYCKGYKWGIEINAKHLAHWYSSLCCDFSQNSGILDSISFVCYFFILESFVSNPSFPLS